MSRRRGFTLIEIMVTVLILAVAMAMAASVFAGILHAARQVGEGRRAFDRAMNARRWLARSLRSMEVGTPAAGPFLGDAGQMRYTSWELVADGWSERAPIWVRVEDGSLIASIGGRRLLLADSVRSLAIDYLLTPGATSQWVPEWNSPSHPPLAVRLRLAPIDTRRATDTLFLLIKERG